MSAGIDTPTLQEIHSVAEDAYQTLATARDIPVENIPHQEVCDVASQLMLDSLLANGHRVERVVRATNVGREYDEQGQPIPILNEAIPSRRISHVYDELDTDGTKEGRQVLDATWQQFLPPEKRTPDIPKVLVGTHRQVIAQLQEYGITDKELLSLWATTPESLEHDLQPA